MYITHMFCFAVPGSWSIYCYTPVSCLFSCRCTFLPRNLFKQSTLPFASCHVVLFPFIPGFFPCFASLCLTFVFWDFNPLPVFVAVFGLTSCVWRFGRWVKDTFHLKPCSPECSLHLSLIPLPVSQILHLHIQQLQRNVITHWQACFLPPDERKNTMFTLYFTAKGFFTENSCGRRQCFPTVVSSECWEELQSRWIMVIWCIVITACQLWEPLGFCLTS